MRHQAGSVVQALGFAQAQRLTHPSDRWYGLAVYDSVIATYYQGAYRQAAEGFQHLLVAKSRLSGFDRRTCALWARHAGACAGYHAERAKLGIPEPLRLDPLCGAAALAAYLRANGLPYDEKHVLSVCRVTQEGSRLQDVLQAARKLGLVAEAVTADDQGLIALPKPLVAYVEHDHFISIVSADKNGVSYLCSDCGPWPGGKIHLNWKQWHALDPGLYVVTGKKDSPLAAALSQMALQSTTNPAGVQLASLHPQGLNTPSRLLSLLRGHVLLALPDVIISNPGCGFMPSSQHDATQCCPIDGGGSGNDAGASGGDPVNLGTLEEELAPDNDFVYNPIGPSVVWGHLYNSLKGNDQASESTDFGMGFSQNYNVGIYDPNATPAPLVPTNGTLPITPNGADAPATGLTWDIVRNGTTVATSSVTNNWYVTWSSGQLSVTAPNVAPAAGYEARYTGGHSAFFDLTTPAPQYLPQGTVGTVSLNGTTSGLPTNSWQVKQGTTVIASNLAPNGWNVGPNAHGTAMIVTVPLTATVGGYTAICNEFYNSTCFTAPFTVYAGPATPVTTTATKYLVLPNAGRISFTASAYPSNANPQVVCAVQAGGHAQVVWNYSSAQADGYYTITFPNRSQFVTTTSYYSGPITDQLWYALSQEADRNGNYINFLYNTPGLGSKPLLSSITDSNNSALLTITRASNGNITQVADRYNRSIYYHESAYSTQNVPPGYPQSQQELDHVSQLVPTGTSNPPDRYAYGYLNVANGEGSELVPFLHTITVPSPTGSGSCTATINYATTGTGYITSLVDANGYSHSYSILNGSQTGVTIKNAQNQTVTSYSANFDNNMSQTLVTNGAGTVVYSATYANPNDPFRPSKVQDGNGYAANGAGGKGTWTYTWDAFGNLLTATTPRNTTTTYTYSYTNFPLGELTQVQEGTKSVSTFAYYEPSGLPKTVTLPLPGTVGGTSTVTIGYTYDGLGNVLTITAPGNNAVTTMTATYNYTTDGTYTQPDAMGQALTVTNNLGNVTHFRYDSRGNTLSVTDSLGNETDSTYNLAGQPVQTTFPATGQTGTGRSYVLNNYLYTGGPSMGVNAYDESGNLVRQVTPTYGPEGEVLSEAGSTEPVTVTYDGAYRLATLADGNNQVRHYYYTSAGYLGGMTYPGYTGAAWPNLSGSDSVQFTSFDNDGNPLTRIDGRGVTTTFVYNDVESLLTNVQYPATPGINVSLGYDSYGRPNSKSDGAGSYSYSYDDDDNLTSTTTTYTGLSAKTLSYGFYPDGSLQTLTTPAGNFAYSYDADGKLTNLSNPSSENFTWTYLNNDWLWKQISTNSSGTQVLDAIATYNALGQITDLTNQNDTSRTLYSDFSSQGHDGVGNLTGLSVSMPAVTAYNGTNTYSYDTSPAKNQIVQEQSTRNGGYTNGFGYDSAGNPTTYVGVVQHFNADNQNTASGYVYDGNGNPTTYQGSSFAFDAVNRLSSIGSSWTAGYTGEGLRAWQQNSGTTTYYLYDGSVPVCELNSSGTVTATNTFGAAGLLSRHTSSSLFYSFDPAGNVAETHNSSGTPQVAYQFYSFGQYHASTTPSDPFGFGGQAGYTTDRSTGLVLLGHRYYDPGQGRFLNRDPISYGGGINLYNYVGNSPLNGSDPSGLKNCIQAIMDGDDNPIYDRCYISDWNAGSRPGVAGAQRFVHEAILMVPGGGFIYMLSGYDVWGCHLSPWQRVMHGANGFGNAVGAADAAAGMAGSGLADAEPEMPWFPGEEGSSCFVAGTPVAMADGSTKPIEQVQTGDREVSHNEPTGQAAASQPDVALSSSQARLETHLNLDLSQGGEIFEETLIVPASEQAMLASGVIKPAKDLKSGDFICMSGHRVALVKQAATQLYRPASAQQADGQGNVVSRVIGTTKRLTDGLLYVYTQDDRVQTTSEHPFYVSGKGWVQAGKLQRGDRLQSQSGRQALVERVEAERTRQMVYNLEVEGTHTFFIGKDRLLVHNGGDCVPELEGSEPGVMGYRGKMIKIRPGTNTASEIGGRRFSGHALDRMQERGFTPSVIEEAINYGTKILDERGAYIYESGDVRAVVEPSDGGVITVIPR
jgi:RHS repeat-associated protein